MTELNKLLQGVKDNGNGQYSAYCPVCEPDKSRGNGHLYFKYDGGKWLLDCKHGCDIDSICAVLNIEKKDLFADTKTTGEWRFIREHIYKDESGNIIGKKEIFLLPDGKKTGVWRRYQNGGYIKGLDGLKPPLYHLPELINTASDTVYFVEGEKDVETMELMGFTAASTPNGAGQAKIPEDCIRYFNDKRIIIIHDNDESGLKYAEVIQNTLRKKCKSVIVINPVSIYPELAEKGDISDIVQAVGVEETKSRLIDAIEKAVNADLYQREYIYREGERYKINVPLLTEYFKQKIKYYLVKTDEFADIYMYVYRNGRYRVLMKDEIKGMIKSMIPLLLQTNKILEETYSLIFSEADESKFISVESFNADENIINFRNGLLYLDTMELKPHTPDVLSTIQVNSVYNPNAKKPKVSHFERYMQDLTENNDDVRKFLLQYMGVALSNVYGFRFKKAFFMTGKGDSGKSQIKELCVKLIGSEYTSGIDLQTLEERFGTSAVYGKRLVGSSDMKYVSVKELNSFKQLVGGDSVLVEFKNRSSFLYKFKGVFWFCCNDLPKFGGDKGQHVYDRIIPLSFDNVIPEDKRDSKLLDKMYTEREYIIKLCVDGLKQVIANGYRYDIPICSYGVLRQYQHTNDSVLQFFDECCEPRIDGAVNDHITKGKTYQYYKAWCRINNNGHSESKSGFHKRLQENRIGETKKTNGGNEFYVSFKMTDNAINEYGVMIS